MILWVLNAVLNTSPGVILIWWYQDLRFILEKLVRRQDLRFILQTRVLVGSWINKVFPPLVI